ncbi:MAG: S9 family peptidase [Muribaculaceae bacterium]|nr:S9 family peptidase [Muribaculaceae bacterium]
MNIGKLLGVSLVLSGGYFSAGALTIEDYVAPSQNAPKGIKDMRPLADGLTYAAISDDAKSIDIYDYKTGKKTGTLFSIDGVKGDVKIDSFDGYTISDNGKKVLLWNDVNKIYRRSYTAQYYVYDVMRSTLKRVSVNGAQRGAVMSHDGRMVAYARGNNIFISNLDYDTDKAITTDGEINKIINGVSDWSYEEEFGVTNTIRWNGDDTSLAYLKFDESEVPTYSFDNYKSFCDSDPLSDPYPSSYTYKYPLAGYPNVKVSVHVYNIDNRTTKKMDLPASDYIPSIEYDGAGTNLMVMLLNRDQNHLQLFRVNPGSTVAHPILEERSQAWLSPSAYQMVTYGKTSFVIGSERSGYCHLYEYDYNGSQLKQITKGDWNVTAYYGKSSKTGTYFFQSTIKGAINRNVCSVDAKGLTSVLNDKEGFESASFSTTMDYYVRTYSNAVTPTVYTICNSKGIKVKDIEDNAAYASKYASAPRKEFLKVKNGNGQEMNAYIIKPANFDPSQKYPLLMTQYNGPDSQEVANRWRMEGVYYLASQGYVVAAVDGRGTGYRDREWANCVYKHLGEYETADQIAGAKYFATLPYIDSSKVGCFGWSYGGYMTLMEISANGNPFKVGVSMAPVTDWRYYDSIYTERYMSTPQQNEQGYNKASALNYTAGMKSRLLIMSGTSDDNVHFYNTLKYTSKLNYEGKVFDMMALTGFEHSLGMCNARVMLFRKIEDFLNNYLK